MTTSARSQVQSAANAPPRVAILGARGIGRVHARIFHQLGAEVCAVLGSTADSAAATANALSSELGAQVKPFADLERLLAEPLDAVSICTPARMHFAQLQAVFDRGLPAFCEKPLFWEDGMSASEISSKLDALDAHRDRRLWVNTSNAVFIDAVRDRLPAADEIDRFCFRFSTHGTARGSRIATDLMPHGLSMLIRLLGRRSLASFTAQCTETNYRCGFEYGTTRVEFDFREGEDTRGLAFRVNDRELRRVQEGQAATYRVYLEDSKALDRVGVEDPFATYIARFLGCTSWADPWLDAAANMRLMAQALL